MVDKIRIAFFIDEIRWPTAGTENQLLRLIKQLNKDTFLPYLIVLRSSSLLEDEWQICETLPLNISRLFSYRTFHAICCLVSWLKRNKVSIVQTFFRDANIIGLVAAALARVPVRLSSRRNTGYAYSKTDLRVYSLLDRLVHYYIANGQAVKEHVIKSEGITPDKIRVFHNLVDDAIVSKTRPLDGSPPWPQIAEQDVVFLMIANLRAVKGHSFLINTVRRFQENIPNAKFILVGGGPNGEQPHLTEVFGSVVNLGLSDRFVFAGLQDDVKPFLEAADVGILCSSSEGFSSTLLEYAAAGLPSIATDVGSNREIVIDQYNGFLVRYDDTDELGKALTKLYSDPGLRETMGKNSRKHFEQHFEPAVQMKKLEQFYIEQVSRSSRTS
jgi:glycosyltransferase involved in cell wall biosynthesis